MRRKDKEIKDIAVIEDIELPTEIEDLVVSMELKLV
jgi:hypothetical protein